MLSQRQRSWDIQADHIIHYNGGAESHGCPDLQVGEEVNLRSDFIAQSWQRLKANAIIIILTLTLRTVVAEYCPE